MTGFLDLLTSAIATQEGFFDADPNVAPRRNHNPGDLRDAPWLPVTKAGGFVIFSSDAEGIAGLYHQIALDVARGHTLRSLLSKYAPPKDHNNTADYVKETARRVGGIDPDVKLWNFLELHRIP